MIAKPDCRFEDFPSQTHDKIRRQDSSGSHVDNILFPAYCDTGRLEVVNHPELIKLTGMFMFVARFTIDYHAELFWPGTIEIGTGIKTIGRSSATVFQALFQNGKCAATAETVMVQVDKTTSRPVPLTDEAKLWLRKFMLA